MSKKSRRERTPNLPPEAYNLPAAAAASLDAVAPGAASGASYVDLKHEYKDVLGDLRKTFAIFIALAVAMLIGSFFYR